MDNRGAELERRVRELLAQRHGDRAIAREFGIDRRTVGKIRRRLGLGPLSQRGLTKAEQDALVARVVQLYVEDGLTTREIGAQVGRSGVQVNKYLRKAGVELGPSGPRRKYPQPEERECAHPDCDCRFTPTGAQVFEGWGRYHSRPCWLRSPEHRELTRVRVRERHARARAELERLKAERGSLETAELAELWDVSPQIVSSHYVPLGLESERLKIHGCLFHVFERHAVERFEKDWLRTSDPRRLACRLWYLDPENYVAFLSRTGRLGQVTMRLGLREDDVEAIKWRQAKRRSQRFKRHLRGRKQGTGPPAFHVEWAERFVPFKTELEQQHACYHVVGDRPPTNLDVALLVAEDDFAEHPDRWSYDPHQFPREAASRVWRAVKPLQIPLRGNSAGYFQ